MPRTLVAVLLLVAAGAARADAGPGIGDAWIRYLPGSGPMAGYFVLSNEGDADRTLVSASSPAFGAIQLHRTVKENGMSSMAPVDAVVIPAHGSVAFEPGGYHLMMMHRQGDLAVGDKAVVTLQFKDGSVQEITFTFKPPWQE